VGDKRERAGSVADNNARVLVVADPPFSQNQIMVATADPVARSLPGPTVLRSALGGSREAIEALPPLAGTRMEAEALDGIFPGTVSLLGPDATESRLREMASDETLGGFDIIHLATHALIDAERPARSALVLSQLDTESVSGDDGMLTVREISRTWRLDSELVTLSACATGLGRRIDGEGYLGFTQSLLAVGASNVLVSLWPVDDQATALFMKRFYGNLAGPDRMTPSESLSEARHWLRDYTTPRGTRPFSAPRYWAGFVIFTRLG
jgi:CHAT domain-containing protein